MALRSWTDEALARVVCCRAAPVAGRRACLRPGERRISPDRVSGEIFFAVKSPENGQKKGMWRKNVVPDGDISACKVGQIGNKCYFCMLKDK